MVVMGGGSSSTVRGGEYAVVVAVAGSYVEHQVCSGCVECVPNAMLGLRGVTVIVAKLTLNFSPRSDST